jgi:hypothetical protein
MPHKGFLFTCISHNRAKKGAAMWLLMILGIAVFTGVRAVQAALASLHALPRSNQDWIWY